MTGTPDPAIAPTANGRIYVYSAPGYDTEWTRTVGATTITGRGRFKVGYTGRADPAVRIKEQTGTVYPGGDAIIIHLDEPAVTADGTPFTDHAVHKVLTAAGISRAGEVFEATLDEIRAALTAVRTGRGYDPDRTADFGLRPEQADAVERTATYFTSHANDPHPPRFLWNAKMRFGKTFTTYQLAKELGWRRVLVLTYKPAVRTSWRDDLASHVDFAGWRFVDRDSFADPAVDAPLIWFASFQDFLGTTVDGEIKSHNDVLHDIEWDCVVLDEYHFGAWQGAAKEVCEVATAPTPLQVAAADQSAADHADEVTDLAQAGTPRVLADNPESDLRDDLSSSDLRLTARHYLYLSGTPFRALTDGEFNEDAIFNWTYPDEQHAKTAWHTDPERDPADNPYRSLPGMEMYTYALSEMASAAIDQGVDGTFDLSGFFAARRIGSEYHFDEPDNITEFLNLIRGQLTQTATEKLLNNFKPPFPYSDARFSDGVQHTVWFLPTVASCHAMAAALATHPHFRNHLVHVAAGGGAKMGAAAKAPVDAMLARADKLGKATITLSCGKLMTGVTVPQWGAILILRSLKSPESYFQAAFRVQSPWQVRGADGHQHVLKHTCYVFDFDPNRALTLIYQYGTKLAAGAAGAPSDVIDELVKVLPIFAFDGGRMDRIDVNGVMDWGTAGAGATMLAKRWGSPRLIDLSEAVLTKLLANSGLIDQLEQMEDFRNLREDADQIIARNKKLKKPRGGPTGADDGNDLDDEDEKQARKEKRERVRTLRDKLLKFVQRIPVFMFLTDFREQALVDVIESLDTQLFERVTGLTLKNFHELSAVGVFQPQQMNEAIWQFRLFERASLSYLSHDTGDQSETRVGLWSTTVDSTGLDDAVADAEAAEGGGALLATDPQLGHIIAQGLLTPGEELTGLNGATATITADHGIAVGNDQCAGPTDAAAAAGAGNVDGWQFWHVPGQGTLADMAELAEMPEVIGS